MKFSSKHSFQIMGLSCLYVHISSDNAGRYHNIRRADKSLRSVTDCVCGSVIIVELVLLLYFHCGHLSFISQPRDQICSLVTILKPILQSFYR
jgi:hypothetical protein